MAILRKTSQPRRSTACMHAFLTGSARAKLTLWQRLSCASLLLLLAAAVVLDALPAIRTLSFVLAVIFLPVIALRLFAAYDLWRRSPGERVPPRLADAELPVYTVLVSLYREANMLASLTGTLGRLDYPAAKLEIKLILESVDVENIAVARALDLPGNVEIVVLDLYPRTKPKALNYALPLARANISRSMTLRTGRSEISCARPSPHSARVLLISPASRPSSIYITQATAG